jgi:transcriptional regulator with XRE-family HTH domain
MTPTQLTAIREEMGLTQAQFAERVGKTRNTVVNWENGRSRIPGDLLAKLAAPVADSALDAAKAAEPLCYDTAPECYFVERVGKHRINHRNLNHPRWWQSTDSPWMAKHGYPEFEPVTLGELATFVPPTPEQAKAMLTANGVSEQAADRFLAKRGGRSVPSLLDSHPEWKA